MRTEKSSDRGGRVTTVWWDSAAELADAADRVVLADCKRELDNSKWSDRGWDDVVRLARSGDLSLVAEAEALCEKIFAAVEAPRTTWAASPCGAFPVVPDFLVGRPDSMRRRVNDPSDRSPVRVFVETTSSGVISAATLRKRGVAYLALTMLLSAERPVELYVVCGLGGARARTSVLNVVRVGDAGPVDLASACNAMTSTGLTRGCGYSYCRHVDAGVNGSWAFCYSGYSERAYVAGLRAAVGATEYDIVVPPMFVNDPLLNDPVAFVQRALDAHRAKLDEAAW